MLGLHLAFPKFDFIKQKEKSAFAVVIRASEHELSDLSVDAEFFIEFALQRLLGGFFRLDFSTGKLPSVGEISALRSAADEKFSLSTNNGGNDNDELCSFLSYFFLRCHFPTCRKNLGPEKIS